jgi:hypothetical protein
VPSIGSLELSWDWSDPRVRDYPRPRLKLVLGYVLGVIAVGAAAFLTRGSESALFAVSAVVVGYTLGYPLLVGIVIGNIKRLVPLPDADPPDD